jgi:hypothetical protein
MTKYTALGSATRKWTATAQVSHDIVRVREPTWETFVVAARLVLKGLEREHPDDDALSRALRFSLFRVFNAPCSPDEMLGDLGLPELLEQARRFGNEDYSALSADLSRLMTESPEHPFATWLRSHVTDVDAPVVVVTRSTNLLPIVQRALSGLGGVRALTPGELADLDAVGTVVVLGSPNKYPGWFRRYPLGRTVWLVWPWTQGFSTVEPFLVDGSGSPIPHRITEHVWMSTERGPADGKPVDPIDDDEVELIDWRGLYRRLDRRRRQAADDDGDEEIDVVVADVGEGQVVLLPADDQFRTTVYDPEAETVQSLPQEEIRTGMFVVVRTKAGRDYIRELVETRFLRDPQHMQRSLSEWKRLLRLKIRAKGRDSVFRALRMMRVSVVPETVASWAGDMVYGPGDYETFKSLMLYLDLFDFDERWAVVQAYRVAGRQAGKYVRERLLEQIRKMPPNMASASRVLEFELDGVESGKVSLYKVERIVRDPVKASSRDIERVFDASEV